MNPRDATAVLEALPLAVLMAAAEGTVTYANAAAHALFSDDVEALTPEERARRWRIRHVDGTAMSAEDLPTLRAIRGERLRNFEYAITHADGRERRLVVSSEPIDTPDGRVIGAACVFEDVTERRRAEQQLADALREQTASALEKARLSQALAARADRLRRITELNRLISAALDTGQVLHEIGRAAADLAGCRVAGFWMLDAARGALELRGGWGDDDLRAVLAGQGSCDDGLAGSVARDRHPLTVPALLADRRFRLHEWARRHGLQSYLGIPILLGDALIGVLGMYAAAPFDLEADEELFEGFVAQAAVAIDNATLYAGAEERRRRAEAAEYRVRFIADSTHVLRASLDRAATARAALRIIVPDLADRCVLELVDASGRTVCWTAGRWPDATGFVPSDVGEPEPPREEAAPRLPALVPEGAARLYAAAEIPDALWRALERTEEIPGASQETTVTSAMVIPIRGRSRVLGTLAVASAGSGRVYDAVTLRLAETLAERVGEALEHAQLFQESEVRREEAERLADLARAVSPIRDEQELGQHVVTSLREILDARAVVLARLDPAIGKLRPVAVAAHTDDGAWLGAAVLPKGTGVAGAAIDARRAIVSEDILSDAGIAYPPAVRGELERRGLRSAIGVPLVAKGIEVIGAVVVLDRPGRRFDADAVRVVRSVADQAALALENVRLYLEAEEGRREAEEAARAKEEFVAVLSHELRTPLGAMLGWVSMLRRRRLDTERAAQGLEAVERNVRLLGRLIDDLLDVSRIVAGKMRLDKRPVELRPLIEGAVDKLRPNAETSGVTIDTASDVGGTPGAGMVLGDPVRLEQILTNLVSNAVKFTPAGGQVSVRLVRAEHDVRIVVRDTGEGIEPQVLPYVFDRFRQADATRTRRQGGLGLGLAIVRSLTQLHGGTVTAESPGRGRGATFTVALPVLAVRVGSPHAGAEHGRGPRRRDELTPLLDGLQVLVVDDHADSREMIGMVLAEAGAVVQLAGSADEGLQRLRESEVDVLVSDLGMPRLDGFDLIRAVRAQEEGLEASSRVVAIALSAYASPEDRDRALAAGFAAYAPKPIDPPDLVALVGRMAPGRDG